MERLALKAGMVAAAMPCVELADRALAFMPGNLPPGIAIANPMLSVRDAAYPISFHERQ